MKDLFIIKIIFGEDKKEINHYFLERKHADAFAGVMKAIFQTIEKDKSTVVSKHKNDIITSLDDTIDQVKKLVGDNIAVVKIDDNGIDGLEITDDGIKLSNS